MSEWLGKSVELQVTNVAHGGVCVARMDGRVIFVSDSLPGETVIARISDDTHAAFWRAETSDVCEPSPHRVPHIWGSASLEHHPDYRAGGAEFGHIDLAWQRELKRQILVDSLQRFAGISWPIIVEPAPGDEQKNGLAWRTRLSLHVSPDGLVGPYSARSHRVISVPDLPLATDLLAQLAPLGQRFSDVERIDLVCGSSQDARVIVRPHLSDKPEHTVSPPLVETVCGRNFQLHERGFWQVHHAAAETLYRTVQQHISEELWDPGALNLDLYGGVGLLAAAVADRFGADAVLTSVESDRLASGYAALNLADFPGAFAQHARVEHYLSTLHNQADLHERDRMRRSTIILDPPRSGAGKKVVATITALRPAQVIYVACDPVAFARDLGYFLQSGYELHDVVAFDLFPHTHHCEVIGVMRAG